MRKFVRLFPAILLSLALCACGITIDGGNLKIVDNGSEIISIGEDGFQLDGNLTGISLDSSGLHIQYPNGGISWDGDGFNVRHVSGSIRIAGGEMIITDKDGKRKTLDTTGEGAEYITDGGVSVRTGKKAALPDDYPSDTLPLMEGFTLNASALLGSVEVVSGYVPAKTVEDATAYYKALMADSNSYSQEIKNGRTVLRAKLDGRDFTVYLCDSLTADAVNVAVVLGK